MIIKLDDYYFPSLLSLLARHQGLSMKVTEALKKKQKGLQKIYCTKLLRC
jgi:hypothetical protein